jgi:hypothetical protein
VATTKWILLHPTWEGLEKYQKSTQRFEKEIISDNKPL